MSGLTFNFDLTDIIVLRPGPATQSFHAEMMVIFTSSGAWAQADGRKQNCVVTKIHNTRAGGGIKLLHFFSYKIIKHLHYNTIAVIEDRKDDIDSVAVGEKKYKNISS